MVKLNSMKTRIDTYIVVFLLIKSDIKIQFIQSWKKNNIQYSKMIIFCFFHINSDP